MGKTNKGRRFLFKSLFLLTKYAEQSHCWRCYNQTCRSHVSPIIPKFWHCLIIPVAKFWQIIIPQPVSLSVPWSSPAQIRTGAFINRLCKPRWSYLSALWAKMIQHLSLLKSWFHIWINLLWKVNLHLPAFKSKSSNPQVVASLAAIALSALEMFTSYCVWRSSLALIAPRSLESKQHLATHFLNLNLYFKVPESPLVFVWLIWLNINKPSPAYQQLLKDSKEHLIAEIPCKVGCNLSPIIGRWNN